MNRPVTHCLVSLGVAACALAGGSHARADEPRRTQWEYRCTAAPRAVDLEALLERWGDDGWELAAAIPVSSATPAGQPAARIESQLCFKRPRAGSLSAQAREPSTTAGHDSRPGAGEPTSHWQPTGEELNAARAVLQPTLDRCGADAREDGQAVIAITILGSGTVTATRAGQSTLSTPTLRCLEEAARSLRFRPFRAALISIDMPVIVHGTPPRSTPPKSAPPAKPNSPASKLDE